MCKEKIILSLNKIRLPSGIAPNDVSLHALWHPENRRIQPTGKTETSRGLAEQGE